MIKLPIVMLSHGDFSATNKLFSYEDHGQILLPVFEDFDLANKFIVGFKSFENDLDLRPQVCQKSEDIRDILLSIMIVCKEIPDIIVNPQPPGYHTNELSIIQEKYSVQEVSEYFNDRPK